MLSKDVKARRKINRSRRIARESAFSRERMIAMQATLMVPRFEMLRRSLIDFAEWSTEDRVKMAVHIRRVVIGKGKWRGQWFTLPMDRYCSRRDDFPLHVRRELDRLWGIYRILNLTPEEEIEIVHALGPYPESMRILRTLLDASPKYAEDVAIVKARTIRKHAQTLAQKSLFDGCPDFSKRVWISVPVKSPQDEARYRRASLELEMLDVPPLTRDLVMASIGQRSDFKDVSNITFDTPLRKE